MNPDAATARRALIRAYRAYLEAEEDLERALEDAAAVVPELRPHGLRPIGAPGSRIRRLTEARSHSAYMARPSSGSELQPVAVSHEINSSPFSSMTSRASRHAAVQLVPPAA